jgi:ABC-type multidrug transport system ATPase subunit
VEISISNLTKQYKGGTFALKDINLNIGNGVFGLLGPNGAGKTTLMRILVTLLKPTSGNATINGLDLQKDRKPIRQMTGYLPQGFSTFAKLKVWEFLDYSASLNKKDKKSVRMDKVDRFLEDVSLFDIRDRRVSKLSGGMKRRLGISQTLIGAPKFMVIDEPTTGLDPEERVKFRSLLSDFSREDRIIILSTHIVGDISSTCSSVALLNSGNIAFHDTPEELINTAKGKVWKLKASHAELDRLKEEFTVISTVPSKEGYELRVVADNINGQADVQTDPNLEDAYVYFMQTLGVKEPQEEEDWSGSSFEDKDHV